MSFGEAVSSVFRQYAKFSGRARRKEYWYFCLFNFIVIVALGIIEVLINAEDILTSIFAIAIFLPGLALSVRRLHDIGKSGWWYLICLIPFVGGIILFVWACFDSKKEENQYGPSPKYC